MSKDRITERTLEDKLPVILREKLERDGFRKTKMPSWDYIQASTPWSAQGLHNKCREIYGISLQEHLRNLGFGTNSSNYYSTTHEPTINSIEYYLKSLGNRRGWSENTINSVRSAIKKATVVIERLGIDDELLTLGKYSTNSEKLETIQSMISIIENINEELADDTTSNYTHYLKEYYPTVGNKFIIDHNPVQEALQEFEFVRKSYDPDPISKNELRNLWTTINALTDCPYQRYELEDWKLWMKIIIVFMIAVGPRACEIIELDTRTDLKFGEDPHVIYRSRKNIDENVGPVNVPIMFGADFLSLVVKYLNEINANGALIPSSQSESGCRSASTINNWIERLCELSNMHFERIPTIQNFRQMWKNQYLNALYEHREYIKFVTGEDKKKDYSSDEESYIHNVENRRKVRDLGRSYFDDLIDITTIPSRIEQTLEPDDEFDNKGDLGRY